jgi:hypothetical protein
MNACYMCENDALKKNKKCKRSKKFELDDGGNPHAYNFEM